VNRSPLGAASQFIADSLSFFYERARRKSRRNSRTAKRKNDALRKNILPMNFTTKEACPTRQKNMREVVAPASRRQFCAGWKLKKLPAGRRRYENLCADARQLNGIPSAGIGFRNK